MVIGFLLVLAHNYKLVSLKYSLPYIILAHFVLLSFSLSAQKTIEGKVVSNTDSLGIPGVAIQGVGTNIGVITNFDGNFSISLPETTDSITFQSIDTETQTIAIGNRDYLFVALAPKSYDVKEVVVTALGISKETKALGYSVTAVDSDELSKAAGKSAITSLQGKVAGVSITNASGAPGASTRVLVRGVSSLSGSNQPLYVIDGVPASNSSSGSSSINGGTDYGNAMNDINPDDIENVSFLKGASATALYGSRAANGVILISTKKAKYDSKTQISVSSSVSFESPLRLVEYQNEFGQGIYGNLILYENTSWGPEFNSKYQPWGHPLDDKIRVKAYRPLPDNVKEFFDVGHNFTNSVAISGATSQTSYYFSYAHTYWDGIFPTKSDSYKSHNLSFRGSQKLNAKFELSSSVNYLRKENRSVPTGQGEQSVYNQIMQTPRDISLQELSDIDTVWNTPDNYYSLYTVNPYENLKNNFNLNTEDRVYGSLELKYIALPTLSFTWRLGGDISNRNPEAYRQRIEPEGNNEFAFVFEPGSRSLGSSSNSQINSDILGNWNKTINNFDVNVMLGQNVNQRQAKGFSTAVSFLSTDDFPNLSNSSQSPSSSEGRSIVRQVALYGNIDLSFKRIIFISASGRNEWSSTLPLANNSYFFPSVSSSFVFTELMNKSNALSFGKIRASWAVVGLDAFPYAIQNGYSQAAHSDGFGFFAYPFAGLNAYNVGNMVDNNNLRPERTEEIELGTDLRFFNNRVSLDLAVYQKNSTDLIWPSPVPYSTGFSYQNQNLGKISNKGIEALINFTLMKRANFDWDFTVNFTRNINKVEYLNSSIEKAELNALRVDGGQQITWVAMEGKPVGVFYARAPKFTSDGKMVVDNQGMPVADEDLQEYGNSQYRYYGGFGSSINYRGIKLSALFDYRVGGLMYSRTKDITDWAGNSPASAYNGREPFIIPNSVVEIERDNEGNPVYVENTTPMDRTKIPVYWANGGSKLDGNSLIDKSFVKLREVALSYSLPQKWMENINIDRINLSLIGSNLWLWTPKDQQYIDPETTTFGNDIGADFGEYGAQPTVRTVSFKINVAF